MIKDHTTRMLIGEGEHHGRFYLFRAMEKGCANQDKEVDDKKLWHCRLEHPSKYRVFLIPDVKNKSRIVDEPCDV